MFWFSKKIGMEGVLKNEFHWGFCPIVSGENTCVYASSICNHELLIFASLIHHVQGPMNNCFGFKCKSSCANLNINEEPGKRYNIWLRLKKHNMRENLVSHASSCKSSADYKGPTS